MNPPETMISLSVLLLLSTFCKVVTSSTNSLELGDGLKVEWSITMIDYNNGDGSTEMTLMVEVPEHLRWVVLGFHGIPFTGAEWEDLAMISIAETPDGKEVSYLKTLHVDANGEVFKSKVPSYQWPLRGGRKKLGQTYYFTLKREVKMIQSSFFCREIDPQHFQSKELLLGTDMMNCAVDQSSIETKTEERGGVNMIPQPVDTSELQTEPPVAQHPSASVASTKQPHLEAINPTSQHILPQTDQHTAVKAVTESNSLKSTLEPAIKVTHEVLFLPPSAVPSKSAVKDEVNDSTKASAKVIDKNPLNDANTAVSKANVANVSIAPKAKSAGSKLTVKKLPVGAVQVPKKVGLKVTQKTQSSDVSIAPKAKSAGPKLPVKKLPVGAVQVPKKVGLKVTQKPQSSDEVEDVGRKEDLKKEATVFLSQLYVDMNLDNLETSLRQKNQSVINEYYRKLKQVIKVVEKIKHAPGHEMANTSTTPCHCTDGGSHWFDFFKNNENSVYFAVIGISAFFTGAIVLCLACCCAKRSTKTMRNIRKSKVSFYKVDDFESSADEVEEFLGDDEADDDLKNLVQGSNYAKR